MKRLIIVALICGGAAVCVGAAPFKEMNPRFNRIKSRVTVRKVDPPTLANFDYAAYYANPVRTDPKPQKIGRVKPVALAELTFDGTLANLCDRIEQTPLTADERENVMAWRPLIDRLWKIVKDQKFAEISGRIEGKRWSDAMVTKPYQEIAAVYFHDAGEEVQFWVKIEFAPWVTFLKDVDDEDKDGMKEIYGRLMLEVSAENRDRAVSWIRTEYCSKKLTRAEIKDWITVLASYWYPTFNTDVVDMGDEKSWPTKTTDKGAIKELKGMAVANPVAVVKGNPFGKILYNVYLAETDDHETPAATVTEPVAAPAIQKRADFSVSAAFKANNERFAAEVKPFGTYDAWAKSNTPYISAKKRFLASLPPGQMGFKGKDDWLFFRKSLEMMVAGDLSSQPRDKNPIPHLVELKKYLDEQQTNLLFVPIPNKEDVYFEKLPFDTPRDATAIVNPYFRKFLKDCQDAGIEVVDVLPLLLAAKAQDAGSDEHMYQHHDTHWTNRGLQIVAQAIADRIKAYSWYAEAAKTAVTYTIVDTVFLRQGDIVERLPEVERSAYPAVELKGQRVYTPDGKPTTPSDKAAPILLMGDSFTGVFELVDCKSAGVGSHIAAKTGLPVDILTSWGGGPLVRERLIRTRKNDMGAKRLVVYMMVARDLFDYAQGWAPLKTE